MSRWRANPNTWVWGQIESLMGDGRARTKHAIQLAVGTQTTGLYLPEMVARRVLSIVPHTWPYRYQATGKSVYVPDKGDEMNTNAIESVRRALRQSLGDLEMQAKALRSALLALDGKNEPALAVKAKAVPKRHDWRYEYDRAETALSRGPFSSGDPFEIKALRKHVKAIDPNFGQQLVKRGLAASCGVRGVYRSLVGSHTEVTTPLADDRPPVPIEPTLAPELEPVS